MNIVYTATITWQRKLDFVPLGSWGSLSSPRFLSSRSNCGGQRTWSEADTAAGSPRKSWCSLQDVPCARVERLTCGLFIESLLMEPFSYWLNPLTSFCPLRWYQLVRAQIYSWDWWLPPRTILRARHSQRSCHQFWGKTDRQGKEYQLITIQIKIPGWFNLACIEMDSKFKHNVFTK